MMEKDNEMMRNMMRSAARPETPADIERTIMNTVSAMAETRIRRKLAWSLCLKIIAILFVVIALGQLLLPEGTGDALLSAGEKIADHPRAGFSWLSSYACFVAPLVMLWFVRRAYRNKAA